MREKAGARRPLADSGLRLFDARCAVRSLALFALLVSPFKTRCLFGTDRPKDVARDILPCVSP